MASVCITIVITVIIIISIFSLFFNISQNLEMVTLAERQKSPSLLSFHPLFCELRKDPSYVEVTLCRCTPQWDYTLLYCIKMVMILLWPIRHSLPLFGPLKENRMETNNWDVGPKAYGRRISCHCLCHCFERVNVLAVTPKWWMFKGSLCYKARPRSTWSSYMAVLCLCSYWYLWAFANYFIWLL